MAIRPRYLVVTQYYHPEPNFITANVAEALATEGDVTVITAHPNYPTGKFYPGTRYLRIERSLINGVTVWRVPMLPDHSQSPIRRGLSYISFAFMASLVAPFVAGRPNTVWVYQTPFTTGLAALYFKAFHRARVVYTCADLWPESFAASGVVRSGLVMRAMAAYSRAINRAADFIVCSTFGTMERYLRDGVPADRMTVVPVWIGGIRELTVSADTKLEPSRRIVYAGNLGPAQKLDTVIAAAAKLQATGVEVDFDLYGSGSSEIQLKDLARKLGAVNVRFMGRVPVDEAFAASSSALAQVVSLKSSALFRNTIPSKIFFAFAAGAPLLYALEGEAATMAAASGGGIPFDADDPDSLVAAIVRLLRLSPQDRTDMREKLRRYYSANYDPSVLEARYRAILCMSRDAPRAM